MIIDFHTHIFPDNIADRAVESLEKSSGYTRAIGGSANDLLTEMKSAGVDLSVNLPILTNPTHFEGTIKKLKEQNEKYAGILSFGAIHPLCDSVKEKLKIIKDLGFSGIKLHPYFQESDINSIENERVLNFAEELDLITVFHTGTDASFRDIERATPDMIIDLVKTVKPKKLVLSHTGALGYFEEVKKYMCGISAYFDTSFSLDEMSVDLFIDIVKSHGADKILFGTDSPWKSQKSYVEYFNNIKLDTEDKEKILYKNALKLLKK